MASSVELNILLRLRDEATKQLGSVNKTLQDNAKNFKIAGAAVTGFGVGVAAGLGMAVKAAVEEEAEIGRLSSALKSVGVDYKNVENGLESYFKEQQKITAYSDGEQRVALTSLIYLTGDYKTALDYMSLAQDLAAAKGIDLKTAAEGIGRATKGSTKFLRDFGVDIKDIEDNATGAKDELDKLKEKVKGTAEEMGKSTENQLKNFNNAINDLKESVGKVLLPAVQEIVKHLTGFIETLDKMDPGLRDFIVKAFAAAAGLSLFIGPVLILLGYLPQLSGFIIGLAGVLGVGGAGGLGAAIVGLLPYAWAFIVALVAIAWQVALAYKVIEATGGPMAALKRLYDILKALKEIFYDMPKELLNWIFGVQKPLSAVELTALGNQNLYGSPPTSYGGTNVTVNVAGSVVTEKELVQTFMGYLLDYKSQNGTTGLQ